MGVLECRNDFAFTPETCRKFGVVGELWREYFERNLPPQNSVEGAIDACHATTANFCLYFVAIDASTNQIEHCVTYSYLGGMV